MTKRASTLRHRFEEKFIPEPNSGCWLWTASTTRLGYGHIRLNKKKVLSAHRVSWSLYRGEIPDGACVCHKCDVRCCVNPDHLFLGTHDDNMADMSRKGRAAANRSYGGANPASRLTEGAVRWIKRNVGKGVTQRQAARRWGVTQGAVSRVLAGNTWKHIT